MDPQDDIRARLLVRDLRAYYRSLADEDLVTLPVSTVKEIVETLAKFVSIRYTLRSQHENEDGD